MRAVNSLASEIVLILTVAIKNGGEWIRFKPLEMDRSKYRNSSYLWSMAKSDGEDITTYLVPGEEGSTTCSTWGRCP